MQTNTKDLILKNRDRTSCGQTFWLMMVVFYALFIIRNVFFFEFPVVVYLIWIAVMAFSFDETEIKALIISFIPFVPGFQSKYAALVCMIAILIRYGKRLKVPLFIVLLPLLMLWELFHLGGEYSSFAEYLSGFAPLMCLVIVLCMPHKNEDISFYTRVLAISSVVAFCILIIKTVVTSNQSFLSLLQEGFRLGSVEEIQDGYAITYNANGLGYLCNIGIAGLLLNVYFKIAKKFDYLMMAFLVLIGCLTVSRTFLLCLAGTVILYILLQDKSLQHKIGIFAGMLVIVFFAFVVLKVSMPNVIDNYVARFNAEDITGGRSYLLDYYNEFICSSPERFWYGIGIQNISEKIFMLDGAVVNVPHNGYQQMIVAWGVVGLFVMMLFLLCMVLHTRRRNRQSPLIVYLPLVLLLVNILAGQFVTSGTKLLSLLFIYLMICNGRKEMIKD